MTLLRYNGFYCLNRVSTTIDSIVRRYVSQVLTRNQNAAGIYRFGYILNHQHGNSIEPMSFFT